MDPVYQEAYKAGYNRGASRFATLSTFSAPTTSVGTGAPRRSHIIAADMGEWAEESAKRILWQLAFFFFFWITMPGIILWVSYGIIYWHVYVVRIIEQLPRLLRGLVTVAAEITRALFGLLVLVTTTTVTAILRLAGILQLITYIRERLLVITQSITDALRELRYNTYTDATYLHYQELMIWFRNHKWKVFGFFFAVCFASSWIDMKADRSSSTVVWTEVQQYIERPIPYTYWRHHVQHLGSSPGYQIRDVVSIVYRWSNAIESKEPVVPQIKDTVSIPETTPATAVPSETAETRTRLIGSNEGMSWCNYCRQHHCCDFV